MAEWYIEQATALFRRFALKHGLKYEVVPDAPIEVFWEFPAQDALSRAITLGLQDDALTFGVEGFWSFFPFESAACLYERVLDAWVEGNARIVLVRLGGRALQLSETGGWRTVYRANCILPVPRNPKRMFTNAPVVGSSSE